MQIQSPADAMLFSTVRVETTGPSGGGTGTAFGFVYTQGNNNWPFFVTNKHVVAGAASGRLIFNADRGGQPSLGDRVEITIADFERGWFGHPNPSIDIAVMPCQPILQQAQDQGRPVYFVPIPHTAIPPDAVLQELGAIEEILFVGYPIGIHDRVNLLPVVRRGVTATPLQVDYEGRPVFLIDASVFPGSSGSPVVICNQGGFATRHGFAVGSRFMLLGVVSQVLVDHQDNAVQFVPIPTNVVPIVRSHQMVDLGVVYKSRVVLETVEACLKAIGEI
jgi:hypothetical protein